MSTETIDVTVNITTPLPEAARSTGVTDEQTPRVSIHAQGVSVAEGYWRQLVCVGGREVGRRGFRGSVE